MQSSMGATSGAILLIILATIKLGSTGETSAYMPIAKSKLAIIVGSEAQQSIYHPSDPDRGAGSVSELQINILVNALAGSEGHTRAEAIAAASRNDHHHEVAVAAGIAVQIGHWDRVLAAITDAFDIARTAGEEQAYGRTIGAGLLHGGDTKSVFTQAVASLFANQGCMMLKPVLAEAMSFAAGELKEENFLSSFDSISDATSCFLPQCHGGMTTCCHSSGGSTTHWCGYFLLKSAPKPMWKCNGGCGKTNVCICM